MGWEVVPPEEYPAMFAALREHRCMTCYQPIEPYDGNLYCYDCDPRTPADLPDDDGKPSPLPPGLSANLRDHYGTTDDEDTDD